MSTQRMQREEKKLIEHCIHCKKNHCKLVKLTSDTILVTPWNRGGLETSSGSLKTILYP